MDKIRNAAIILIGLGDKCASDILKNMSPKEVKLILEAINSIDNVTEADVVQALNEFLKETNSNSGMDVATREHVRNSIMTAVGNKGIASIVEGVDGENDRWVELVRSQPPGTIIELIQDEHPQIVTAFVIVIFNFISTEYGTKLIKMMPKPLQVQVFRRMSGIGSMSKVAVATLAHFFERELDTKEKNNIVTLDGLETVANIISYLDTKTEQEIMSDLTANNKALGEKIQDKIFPFQRLAEMDKKSLQTLMKEVKNEDLVLALKGVEDHVKMIFMQNMSTKSAEILKDEMDTKGPVKLALVLDAQKRIIRTAKQLNDEEKIILSSKNDPDIVF
jgi:flagellar motor switch protein FliG